MIRLMTVNRVGSWKDCGLLRKSRKRIRDSGKLCSCERHKNKHYSIACLMKYIRDGRIVVTTSHGNANFTIVTGFYRTGPVCERANVILVATVQQCRGKYRIAKSEPKYFRSADSREKCTCGHGTGERTRTRGTDGEKRKIGDNADGRDDGGPTHAAAATTTTTMMMLSARIHHPARGG